MSDAAVESFSAATSSTTVSETTPDGTVSTTSTTTADSNHPEPVTTTTSSAMPSFLSSSSSSSSSSAFALGDSSSSPSPFSFGAAPGQFGLSSSSDASGSSAPSEASAASGSSDSAGESAEVAPEEESTAQYTPVVRLQEVSVTTGEEEDDVVWTQRAALYRFDGAATEWKERGKGDCRLLRNKATGKIRILMRQEKTLKLCANHIVLPGLTLKANAGSDRSWTWRTTDFAGDEPEDQTFAIRFKDSDTANAFKAQWEEAKESNAKLMNDKPSE